MTMGRKKITEEDRKKKDFIFKKSSRKKRKKYKYKNPAAVDHVRRKMGDIFDKSTDDLGYITNNKELYEKHVDFIYNSKPIKYSKEFKFIRCVVPDGPFKGTRVSSFKKFSIYYKFIYERWVHLIRSLFDPKYYLYKYFGGMGIYASDEFLNGRRFCLWCIRNGITGKLGSYTKYIFRIDKTQGYSRNNCLLLSDNDIYTGKTIDIVLTNLQLAKKYEECHHESVSFMTAYTRFFAYDLPIEESLNIENVPRVRRRRFNHVSNLCFKPQLFYKSVADETSCSYTTFLSRMHYMYLNGGLNIKPYDMLRPDFSISEEANAQGKLSYKQKWERDRKENKEKFSTYIPSNIDQLRSELNIDDVYSTDSNVYTPLE